MGSPSVGRADPPGPDSAEPAVACHCTGQLAASDDQQITLTAPYVRLPALIHATRQAVEISVQWARATDHTYSGAKPKLWASSPRLKDAMGGVVQIQGVSVSVTLTLNHLGVDIRAPGCQTD